MLRIENASVEYGGSLALRGISLTLGQAEIVALIGANGAGKSTALNAISGLVPLSGGSIALEGRQLSGLSPREIVQLGVAQVPEGRRVFSILSVRDNLLMGAHIFGRREAEQSLGEVFELFPELAAISRRLGGALSGGQQQMLAIGRALMMRPRLLLLDEPSLGLAPVVVDRVAALVGTLRQRGLSILLVEQNAALALDLSDRAYVIERGRILSEGRSQDLAKSATLSEAFLGLGSADAA